MADTSTQFDPDAYLAQHSQGQPQPFDPDAYIAQNSTSDESSPGMISKALTKLDSYSGAPVRAAIGSLESGINSKGFLSAQPYEDAANTLWQSGKDGVDPSTVPTWKGLIPDALSLSDKPMSWLQSAAKHIPLASDSTKEAIGNITPKDMEAFGLSMPLDPANYVPVGKAIEAVGAPFLEKLGGAAESATTRGGEMVTGVPSHAIQNYIDRPEEIKALSQANDGQIPTAADSVRTTFQKNIKDFKSEQNGVISDALANSSPAKDYDMGPIRDFLQEKLANLDPKLEEEDTSQLSKILSKVPEGNVTAEQLYKTRKFLQGKGVFNEGTNALEKTPYAKAMTAQASGMIGPMLEQAAKDGNISQDTLGAIKNLSKVWDAADEVTNDNLITPKTPEASLIVAGGNPNSRGYQALKALEDATGKPFIQPAQDLASMHYFENPSLTPTDTTGKTVARQNIAKGITKGLIGVPLAAAAHGLLPEGIVREAGVGGALAAANVAGNYLASPAALKAGIGAGKALGNTAKGLLGLPPALQATAYEAAQNQNRKKKPGLLNAAQ